MCTNPIPRHVKSRTFGTYRWVDTPCGKCSECLKQRQNSWKLRMCEEAKNWSYVYFFTLTYREDALPLNIDYDTGECWSTARKKHVQDWIKRMRERVSRLLGDRMEMKYFVCAEYGPKPTGTKRPHYHGVILSNCSYNDFFPSFQEWREMYGRMEFKLVRPKKRGDSPAAANSRVANYVSKYCAKGEFNSRKSDIEAGLIERSWICSSKNIGASFVENMKDHYLSYVPSLVDVAGDWSIQDFEKLGKNIEHAAFWREVDDLIRNMKVYNGLDGYGYRMPRYYRERIFMKKRTYKDPIPFSDKIKKTTRYVAENFLSVAITYRQRMLIEARLVEKIRRRLQRRGQLRPCYTIKQRLQFEDLVANEVLEIEKEERLARSNRERVASSQLCRFYQSNMFGNPEFD